MRTSQKDPRIDRYIKDSPPFAKPILNHLRKVIISTCPDCIETIKWDVPWFIYSGKVLCGLYWFKKGYCALLFWKGSQITDHQGKRAQVPIAQLRRIKHVDDLPSPSQLKAYIKQAMKLNEPGAKRPIKRKQPPVVPPADLMQAFKMSPKAHSVYAAFTPNQQRDYVNWILDAKTEETRERRLETAVEWMGTGKTRYWKYQRR